MTYCFYDENQPLIPLKLNDEFFLNVQGNVNVYSLAAVQPAAGPAQLLVAATNKLIHVVGNEDGELLKKEVELHCLPGNCRIKSLASHVEQHTGALSYAFTTVSDGGEGDTPHYSVHLHYQHWNQQQQQLYQLPCQQLPLTSLPYQLLHTTVPAAEGERDVWVITGSELVVVGSQPVLNQQQQPQNTSTGNVDNSDLSSNVTSADKRSNDGERPSDQHQQSSNLNASSLSSTAARKLSRSYPDAQHCDELAAAQTDENDDDGGDDDPNRAQSSNLHPSPREESSASTAGGYGDGGLAPRCCVLNAVDYFPEFQAINFRVLSMQILRTPDGTRRLTAACGEDGSVCLFDVKLHLDDGTATQARRVPSQPPTVPHPLPTVTPNLVTDTKCISVNSANRKSSNWDTCQEHSTLSSDKEHDSSDTESSQSSCDEARCCAGVAAAAGAPPITAVTEADTLAWSADVLKATVLRERRFKFEHPMSSVLLFRGIEPRLPYPDTLPCLPGACEEPQPDLRTPAYQLLTTSTVHRSHVFDCVLDPVSCQSQPLAGSSRHDSVLCSLTAHLTGDRRRYILLGTYDQSILIYEQSSDLQDEEDSDTDDDNDNIRKMSRSTSTASTATVTADSATPATATTSTASTTSTTASTTTTSNNNNSCGTTATTTDINSSSSTITNNTSSSSSSTNNTSSSTITNNTSSSTITNSTNNAGCAGWVLAQKVSVGAPVLAMAWLDMTGDGVNQLLVLTAAGLQSFMLDARLTAKCLTQRLQSLLPGSDGTGEQSHTKQYSAARETAHHPTLASATRTLRL